MRDYMDIGSGPTDEPLAQVGANGYRTRARLECKAWIAEVKSACGKPPKGAVFTIKANPHDFGTYYTVAVVYNDEDEAATDYALKCESVSIETWTDAGMAVIHRDPHLDVDAMTAIIIESQD